MGNVALHELTPVSDKRNVVHIIKNQLSTDRDSNLNMH